MVITMQEISGRHPVYTPNFPIENPVFGIKHGPYQPIPEALKAQYTEKHAAEAEPKISQEQLHDNLESEWQYDQHSEAVMTALEEQIITPAHAAYMLKVLRPWWIGLRQPRSD